MDETHADTDFGSWGRYHEIPLGEMTPDQRRAHDLMVQQRGQVPGPYKILIHNPKLLDVVSPFGVYFQLGHSSLSAEESEIAVGLINGKWMASYPNYEHEKIGEKAGIDPDKMEKIIAGIPTSFDDARQQIVYDLAQTLIAPRIVPTGMYERAVRLLGHDGITDLTALLGYFTIVSLTMAVYDVPANAVGLDQ